MILVDRMSGEVVGTYRMQVVKRLRRTSDMFRNKPLTSHPLNAFDPHRWSWVERACILTIVITKRSLLWKSISDMPTNEPCVTCWAAACFMD